MQKKASNLKPGMLVDTSSEDGYEDIILITSVNYGVSLEYKCFVLADPDSGIVSGTTDFNNIFKVISGPEKTKIIEKIKNDQLDRQNNIERDLEMLHLVEAMSEEPSYKEKVLILTVGLPRSGKSTWAREQIHPVVNPDSIRLALHGQAFVQEAEGFVWEIAYLMTKSLFIAGHDTVIIDATNINERSRNSWKNKFPGVSIKLQIFNTPVETCIQRAKNSGTEYLIPVIKRMNKTQDFM